MESSLPKKLSESVLSSMKTFEVIKGKSKAVNSLSFSREGLLCLATTDDDEVIVFNLETREEKKFYSKTYGARSAVFTNSNQAFLCAGKIDCFPLKSHSNTIQDISVNPLNDTFLSTSVDSTTRLWDLSSKKCLLILQESSTAAFDSTGCVFASNMVTRQKGISDSLSNHINLHDAAEFTQGAYKKFKVDNLTEPINQLEFSNNGKLLIANSLDPEIFVFDSFEGKILFKVKKDMEDNGLNGRFSISPCSSFLACGMENGDIFLWNLQQKTDEPFCKLKKHVAACGIVKFNPKFAVLASGCINVCLWSPTQ